MLKKVLFTIFACTLFLNTAYAQSHQDVVVSVKAGLVAQGADLSGACGAFKITKRVAWQLRVETAGLLTKTSGNNCDGYATDIVAYPDGRIFDILIDAGASNGPAWNADGTVDPSRYHVAIDPGDVVTPPQPPVPPPAPPVDLGPLMARVSVVEQKVRDVTEAVIAQRAVLDNFLQQLADLHQQIASLPLPSKPIPVSCSASVLGIGVRCRLNF
jgi:hypothetical protein